MPRINIEDLLIAKLINKQVNGIVTAEEAKGLKKWGSCRGNKAIFKTLTDKEKRVSTIPKLITKYLNDDLTESQKRMLIMWIIGHETNYNLFAKFNNRNYIFKNLADYNRVSMLPSDFEKFVEKNKHRLTGWKDKAKS